MSRIFFVSIARSVDPMAYTMDDLYARIGQNTGNLLFTNAAWRHIAWTEAGSGYIFTPEYVNARYESVVIPAANWMYEGFDFGDLADRVSRLKVPVVLMGIGAQTDGDCTIPKLPDGTVRLLRAVSERCALIGTRGEFSSEVLDAYGIRNHLPIGCPSMYLRASVSPIRKSTSPARIMLGGTRFGLPRLKPGSSETAQAPLYQRAVQWDADMNYQSERPELDFLLSLRRGVPDVDLPTTLAAYYGVESSEQLAAYLEQHGTCFFDADDWIAAMRQYDFYIGSRIHGAIASLLAGTPALLISHDSRTVELADYAGIPRKGLTDITALDGRFVSRAYEELDFGRFLSLAAVNRQRYISFLEANGLAHRMLGDESESRRQERPLAAASEID